MWGAKRIGTGLVVCAALVAACVAASPALAKSPPKGKYECTIGGYYADTIKIKSAKTYKRFGKSGKYAAGGKKKSFPQGYKGYTIKFKTGPFKGFKGNWHNATQPGTQEIALRNPLNGFEDTYCSN